MLFRNPAAAVNVALQSPEGPIVFLSRPLAGHRNTRGTPLPLKRGMLYYAYSRQLPVQIITGRNKEAILSEKGMVARLGQTVGVGYSGGQAHPSLVVRGGVPSGLFTREH